MHEVLDVLGSTLAGTMIAAVFAVAFVNAISHVRGGRLTHRMVRKITRLFTPGGRPRHA